MVCTWVNEARRGANESRQPLGPLEMQTMAETGARIELTFVRALLPSLAHRVFVTSD